MAAGRPVLFAADGREPAVREADCGRTVAPEDPAALAGAIRSLAACSPAERQRLGANARAYVERAPRLRAPRRRARRHPAGSTSGDRARRAAPGDGRARRRAARARHAVLAGPRRALRDPARARRRPRRRGDRARRSRASRCPTRSSTRARRRSTSTSTRRPTPSTRPPWPSAMSPRTRVVLAQNTFGLSADLDALTAVARPARSRGRRRLHARPRRDAIGAGRTARRRLAAFYSTQWSKPISTGPGGHRGRRRTPSSRAELAALERSAARAARARSRTARDDALRARAHRHAAHAASRPLRLPRPSAARDWCPARPSGERARGDGDAGVLRHAAVGVPGAAGRPAG